MVKVAWQNFSICNTLTIVEESVREIKQSTLNGGWQKLWNEVVTNSRSFLPVVEEIENVVASAKCLSGEGFEDIELNDIAELLDSHPQQIVEKYFRDVITAKVDKRGQQRLTSRTRRMLKHSLCKSNCRDDSEERDPLVEYLLTFRQGLNDYLQLYKAVRRILQTRPISLFSLLASTGEKRLDHRAVCCSNPFRTSRQKGCIQIVEPWDSEFDSSDDVVIHMLEDESGAED